MKSPNYLNIVKLNHYLILIILLLSSFYGSSLTVLCSKKISYNRLSVNDSKSKKSEHQHYDISATALSSSASPSSAVTKTPYNFSNSDLDKKILKLSLPAILNFAIVPLVGAVDTFYVGRMSNALALAGQGAANQVFSSSFWIISFLPNIIAPLIAKAAGAGDKKAVQNRMNEALFVGTILGLFGMILLTCKTDMVLSLVLPGAASLVKSDYAHPYLKIRGFTFMAALLSTIGFSGFRGTMDVVTPLKIAIFSNLVNLVLDPILMFNYKMGISGAALATCVSEVTSCILYLYLMIKKELLDIKILFRIPSLSNLKPLMTSGLTVQMRAVALNIAFLAVTRRTQSLDSTGTAAAAHSISLQVWQLTGFILLALSNVASILVPNELAKAKQSGNNNPIEIGKFTADRMLYWGVVLGVTLCALQLLCVPLITVFSPLKEVQDQAKWPAIIGALLQIINGVVFIGEGIQQGNNCFLSLACTTMVGTSGMLLSMKFFGSTLLGVWASFGVFNIVRLLGVLRHHFISGPLAPKYVELEKLNNSNNICNI